MDDPQQITIDFIFLVPILEFGKKLIKDVNPISGKLCRLHNLSKVAESLCSKDSLTIFDSLENMIDLILEQAAA